MFASVCVFSFFFFLTLSNKVRDYRIVLGIGIPYLNDFIKIVEKSSSNVCHSFET